MVCGIVPAPDEATVGCRGGGARFTGRLFAAAAFKGEGEGGRLLIVVMGVIEC